MKILFKLILIKQLYLFYLDLFILYKYNYNIYIFKCFRNVKILKISKFNEFKINYSEVN